MSSTICISLNYTVHVTALHEGPLAVRRRSSRRLPSHQPSRQLSASARPSHRSGPPSPATGAQWIVRNAQTEKPWSYLSALSGTSQKKLATAPARDEIRQRPVMFFIMHFTFADIQGRIPPRYETMPVSGCVPVRRLFWHRTGRCGAAISRHHSLTAFDGSTRDWRRQRPAFRPMNGAECAVHGCILPNAQARSLHLLRAICTFALILNRITRFTSTALRWLRACDGGWLFMFICAQICFTPHCHVSWKGAACWVQPRSSSVGHGRR